MHPQSTINGAQSDRAPSSPAGQQMVASLGLFSATTIVVGSMIGSGIFIVDCDIARLTDSPALYLGAWIVTAVMTMICALSYGELAAMMPKAGGQYVYLRESLGPLWGFLYGWTLFLVIETGTIAAVCVAFGKFLGVFFPVGIEHALALAHRARSGHSRRPHAARQHGHRRQHRESRRHSRRSASSPPSTSAVCASARSCKTSSPWPRRSRSPRSCFWDSPSAATPRPSRPTSAATGTSSGATRAGIRFIPCRWARRAPSSWWALSPSSPWCRSARSSPPTRGTTSPSPPAKSRIPAATCRSRSPSASASCWWSISSPARHTSSCLPLHGDPHGATVFARGVQYASEDRIGAAVLQQIFPGVGGYLMAAAILISTFGCANGITLSGARAYYAMAQDGLFFGFVGKAASTL